MKWRDKLDKLKVGDKVRLLVRIGLDRYDKVYNEQLVLEIVKINKTQHPYACLCEEIPGKKFNFKEGELKRI